MKLRIKKLTERDLQLRMTSWFVAGVVLAVGLQFLLTVNTMTDVALEAHASPADAYSAVAAGATRILLKTLFVALPVMVAIGILTSFRVCGPLVRIKRFLAELSAGERPEDIRLREGDELHDLAELLNETTRPLRLPAQEDEDVQRTAA